jgi:hypothetical protein
VQGQVPFEAPATSLASGEPSTFGLDTTDTFVGGSDATPTRRPRKRLVSCLAAVVVLAAVGSVVAVVTGGKSAEAAVIDSVNSTMADRTADISMNLSAHVSTGTATGSGTVTGTGSGAIDFSQNAMQLQINVGVANQQIQMQTVYSDGSIYENIPGIDEIVPGKTWVSFDLSSLGASTNQSPSSLGTGNNPAAMLHLLTQQGNKVVALGSSTVDGVSVQGYSVTLNAAAIKSKLATAKLPSWMTSALKDVNFQDTTVKVYVDGSGFLRRMALNLTETVASAGQVTADESLDFSNYGTAVNVSAPPSDQVVSLQQFVQAAEAAQGKAAS